VVSSGITWKLRAYNKICIPHRHKKTLKHSHFIVHECTSVCVCIPVALCEYIVLCMWMFIEQICS
jgi:hypothetical protein